MAFKTYSPRRVTFSFKGLNISAFAEGTFIKVSRNEDGFTTQVGSNGDVTRTKNLNRTGKITITLVATSLDNDLLAAMYIADELVDAASPGVGAIQVKDLSGNMRCRAPQAWIMKIPDVERAKESGNVEWVFECAELEVYPGGNFF
jgi:hypothetical protein